MKKKEAKFPLSITVQQDKENPEPVEVIAQAVIDIAEAFKRIKSGRLTQYALIILIKEQTGLPQKTVKSVLDACENLAKVYTK